MRQSKYRICIVIPAYNEQGTIHNVVVDLLKKFNDTKISADVVVINDGSSDSTEHQALAAGATVINHILNSGAGAATATGLRYAEKYGYDIAATMDADGQHSANDVIKGIGYILENDNDLLIGSRLINSEGMSRVKVIGNRGLSFITFILFGVNVTDSQSGLRIFSRKALEKLRWKTSGYEFCSEMLWRAKQQGLEIGEYPIEAIYTDYSKSKGQNNWNAYNIISSLVRRRIMELINE